ncbi:hypothetical protein, partial [Bradyrhizobium ottawaense]|uniref:hypothetical protein n=1 Tax=Bradyrhizobium ottawaense TaxID=931866 RepID=UPI0030C76D0E
VANRGCFCGAPLHEAYALGRAPLLVAAEGCFSAAPKSANVLNRTGRNNLGKARLALVMVGISD